MTNADWQNIPGFDRYRINRQGEVLSYCQDPHGKILKPTLNDKGYPVVFLYSGDGTSRPFKIHTLVAMVFLPPRPKGKVIRHLNGNQLDNRPENLAYGTHSENNFDLVAHGTHYEAARETCNNGHPWTPDNTMWRKGKHGKMYRKCKACHAIYVARWRKRKRDGLI